MSTDKPEAVITIDGRQLSHAEALTVRVAIGALRAAMMVDAGDDPDAIDDQAFYSRECQHLLNMIVNSIARQRDSVSRPLLSRWAGASA